MPVQDLTISSAILSEVLEGLHKHQKTLPSKYFYDNRGSELFEQICNLEEYYLTRKELSVMKENMDKITDKLGEDVQLIELGSGSSLKTRLLLDHLKNLHSYVPVDISEEFLANEADNLRREYPNLQIEPVAADYTRPFDLPDSITSGNRKKVAYFPGSTIGNFTKVQASQFIGLIKKLVGEDGGLLIGFDLIKDRNTLIAAYDDAEGVTAAFNKNILHHLNRELDSNFNPDKFNHRAIFNEEKSRVEMHLVSLEKQQVRIDDQIIAFEKGETIHTENSHKYSLESFRELTVPYFENVTTWTDSDQMFTIQYLN